jgi:CRP-like cAMP-binding protein
MDEMEGSKAFTEFVHRIAGVVKTGLDGKPEVIDYYKDSFTYVLSSLIDRTRDFYEYELGIKRDSDEGRKIAKDLCEFWYGVGQQAGLRQGPATVEDHDKFVEAHEARIFREMRASPSMQAKASLMAGRFMRSIAEYSNSSEDAVAKLMIKLRPETLGHLLGIDSREWPTEQIRARPSERKHKADVLAEDDPTVQALRRANVENDLGIATIIQLGHLGHLTKDELKRETVHVMRGEELTTEGKQPDKLYVVLGTTTPLEVTQKTPDGQDVLLDTIQPGGKPTVLMEGLVRRTRIATETVRAQQEGDVDVVSIPKEAFLALMEGGEDKRWIETAFLPKVQAISKRDESKRDELARQRMQSSDRKSAIE